MKRLCFTTILTIFFVFNVFARGRVEMTYDYPYPKQYVINMDKEEMISKLQNIVNTYNDGNSTYIPIRMYLLKTPNGNQVISLKNDQSGDIQAYGDVTFYFYIQYIDNSIFLTECNIFIAEDLNFIPSEIEIEKIFYHTIVEYLLEEEVHFEYVDTEGTELSDTTDFNTILLCKNIPSYGDFRTKELKIYRQENIEVINSILKYEWIIKKANFPNDYIFYRYPDYRIEIYDRNDYRNGAIMINIWKNAAQYFVQLSTTKEYYAIDEKKLNEILYLLNIEI
jgi:hypothetical protein